MLRLQGKFSEASSNSSSGSLSNQAGDQVPLMIEKQSYWTFLINHNVSYDNRSSRSNYFIRFSIFLYHTQPQQIFRHFVSTITVSLHYR